MGFTKESINLSSFILVWCYMKLLALNITWNFFLKSSKMYNTEITCTEIKKKICTLLQLKLVNSNLLHYNAIFIPIMLSTSFLNWCSIKIRYFLSFNDKTFMENIFHLSNAMYYSQNMGLVWITNGTQSTPHWWWRNSYSACYSAFIKQVFITSLLYIGIV